MQVSEMNYTQPYEITKRTIHTYDIKIIIYSSAKDKNIIDKISFSKLRSRI